VSGYGLAYSIRGYAGVVKGKGKRRNPNYGTGPAATPEPTKAPCAWEKFLRGMGLSERDALELIGSKSQEWARIKTWVLSNVNRFSPEEIRAALGIVE
jgi:hypothetical protein